MPTILDGVVLDQELDIEFGRGLDKYYIKLKPGHLVRTATGEIALDLVAIADAETTTVLGYKPATKVLSYKDEDGVTTNIDLSLLAVDVQLSDGTFDQATFVATWTDSDGSDVVMDLSELKKTVTAATNSITLSGTGEASAPLKASLIVDPIAGNPLSVGPLGAKVTLPPALILTDNAIGILTIDPGVNPQQAIRPIQELAEIGARIAISDLFPVLDISAGVDVHRSAYGDRVDRFVNEPMIEASLANSPGGLIPQTMPDGARNILVDAYVDFNGSHIPTITLPAPTYIGQTFLFKHFATTNTTIATTNTNRTSPLLVTQAQGGAEFVALPNDVAPNPRWALRTESPVMQQERVVETFRSIAANYVIPAPVVVTTPELKLTTIETFLRVTAPAIVTLPAPAGYPQGVEIDTKLYGTWTGTFTVNATGGALVDGAAAFTMTKDAAQPSWSFRSTGTEWLIV